MQFTARTNEPAYAPANTASPAIGWTHSGKLLWVVQGALAAVFLFAGSIKLILPISDLQGPVGLPALFIRFIGVCEAAGAFGLVLPGVLGVRRGLTPLAAAGLVVIMIGATVVTIAGGQGPAALMPVIVGCLAAFVAVRRSRVTRS